MHLYERRPATKSEVSPAARRVSTALRLYSEAHTKEIASAKALGSDTGTFATDSYSPAPDMPAKSSTFADDLTITLASLSKDSPAIVTSLVQSP